VAELPEVKCVVNDGKALFTIDGGTARSYSLSFTMLGKSGLSRKAIERLLKDAFKIAYAQRTEAK
jgi:hypothetical protein